MRRSVPPSQLCALQRAPEQVRNICILAHVDHGKTTLADSLVASNGVISARMAGKLRYMDSREDEQLRGITMKSSAIALLFEKAQKEYLINLVDSPGHVDFSSEVSTAVRACDGAIVLVDAVEGVCPQTHVVLRQAWREGVKPVLVINKIDRLISELQMTPTEAHLHLSQVLEQVNAVTGSLFATEVMETAEREAEEAGDDSATPSNGSKEKTFEDWELGFDKKDEDALYFCPDKGNVVFASAVDGWGFRVCDFASLYASKLGISEKILRMTLWGDYYLNMKSRRILKGAQAKGKKPLFVQFILDNMWAVYEAISNRDSEKIAKITKSMNLTLAARDLRSADPRVLMTAVCGQWLPLANCLLGMVVEHLPSPLDMTAQRAENLLCGGQRALGSYPPCTRALKDDLLSCSSSEQAPVIAFVSKMFSVKKSDLAHNKTSVTTARPMPTMAVSAEEIAARRQQAKLMSQQRTAGNTTTDGSADNAAVATTGEPSPGANTQQPSQPPSQQPAQQPTSTSATCHPLPAQDNNGSKEQDEETTVLLAFTRVFSGTLTTDRKLFVLRSRHDPDELYRDSNGSCSSARDDPEAHPELDDDAAIVACQPRALYLLMGRDLVEIDHAPAGCVVGIAGLDQQILRHGTISSTTALPPLAAMEFPTSAVLRVALEPGSATMMSLMLRGLRRLRAADPAVEYCMESSGECVLSTAGEVHLERCLDDLKAIYAPGLQVSASDPIVPFRETVVPAPEVDMVNESIDKDGAARTAPAQTTTTSYAGQQQDDGDGAAEGGDAGGDVIVVEQYTADHSVVLRVRALPLPDDITAHLEKHAHLLRAFALLTASAISSSTTTESTAHQRASLRSATIAELIDFKRQLGMLLEQSSNDVLQTALESIIAFGPSQVGPNILLNCVEDYKRPSVWKCLDADDTTAVAAAAANGGADGEIRPLEHSVLHGFQLATLAGPLCEEPVHGVCFVLETWSAASECNTGGGSAVKSNGNGLNTDTDRRSPQSLPSDESRAPRAGEDSTIGRDQSSVSRDGAEHPLPVVGAVSTYGPLSGQLMSAMKEACRRAMLTQPARIMVAMYSCEIHATSEVLGRVYAVLGRRGGRVVLEDLRPGSTNVFSVRALVPVAESFGFATEIRKKTSGSASPQLFFSHWEAMSSDPFWVPTTEEELLHFGEKADSENQARLYMNAVRRRKGLTVSEKIVEHAEKQRTIMRS